MAAMNGTPQPSPTAIPLRVERAVPIRESEDQIVLSFNRKPTPEEVAAYSNLPPPGRMANDLSEMMRRAMTFEAIARLCRTYVLSGIMFSEGPAVTQWLRAYIDGEGETGPLGAPLPWPDGILVVGAKLREWGFERSPNGWLVRAGTFGAPAGTRRS